MGDWFQQLSTQFAALSPARRSALVATTVASLAFFLWIAWSAGRGGDQLLYRELAEDESARIVEVLQGERIPYRLENGGTAILVPAAQLAEARIRVAAQGLPAGGGAGFELFDRPGFGVTDFVHRVNYRRALQGELARSIEQLAPVARARVQIAMPERSPFLGDRSRKPSASVVVRLAPGGELEAAQVRGIVHLVASSVERLAPERVTVVDDRGRLLAAKGEGGPGLGAPAGAHAHQTRLENDLAARIESILGRTVGEGRVVARVRADLDWTQTESTEERFDPDSQVERSEQRTTESSTDGGGFDVGGVPGVQSNLGGGGPEDEFPGLPSPSGSSRTTETINYEISKVVSRSVKPVGEIKRLTVAVLVDGKPGEAEAGFQPWEEPELRKFEELARQAVGFTEERGDEITVTNAPFRSIELDEEGGGWLPFGALAVVTQLLHGLALLAALVLFGRLVVRPLAQSLAVGERAAAPLPARAEDLELQLAGAGAAGGPATPELPRPVAEAGPQRADEGVKTIQTWLRQR